MSQPIFQTALANLKTYANAEYIKPALKIVQEFQDATEPYKLTERLFWRGNPETVTLLVTHDMATKIIDTIETNATDEESYRSELARIRDYYMDIVLNYDRPRTGRDDEARHCAVVQMVKFMNLMLMDFNNEVKRDEAAKFSAHIRKNHPQDGSRALVVAKAIRDQGRESKARKDNGKGEPEVIVKRDGLRDWDQINVWRHEFNFDNIRLVDKF